APGRCNGERDRQHAGGREQTAEGHPKLSTRAIRLMPSPRSSRASISRTTSSLSIRSSVGNWTPDGEPSDRPPDSMPFLLPGEGEIQMISTGGVSDDL